MQKLEINTVALGIRIERKLLVLPMFILPYSASGKNIANSYAVNKRIFSRIH